MTEGAAPLPMTGYKVELVAGTVLETLERVNRELGTTTGVITHNVPIAQMANTVVELVDGQVSKITHPESRIAPSELRW